MGRTTYERELTDAQKVAFAAGLKRLRAKRDVSFRALGELSGVHYSRLSDIENQALRGDTGTVRRVTSYDQAEAIADALGTEVWRMLR
jgi:hypothetical protein